MYIIIKEASTMMQVKKRKNKKLIYNETVEELGFALMEHYEWSPAEAKLYATKVIEGDKTYENLKKQLYADRKYAPKKGK